MTILEALRDPKLLAPWFRDASTWRAWQSFLAALFALPMPDAEALDLYRKHTGREALPTEPVSEAWVVVGRRGGKSLIAALVAVFLAVLRDYSDVLSLTASGLALWPRRSEVAPTRRRIGRTATASASRRDFLSLNGCDHARPAGRPRGR